MHRSLQFQKFASDFSETQLLHCEADAFLRTAEGLATALLKVLDTVLLQRAADEVRDPDPASHSVNICIAKCSEYPSHVVLHITPHALFMLRCNC